mmetsp:Transcript_2969/g.4240  ORF Transcript_2969/g.4240 Transcript_2969/m.4240 type:complete len:223 (-) Transcript_2969:2642-3310(-)
MTLVHGFITMTLVTHCVQTFADIGNMGISKGGSVTLKTLEDRNFTENTLNQLSDSHTRWNGVGVDNNIRYNTFACEWHVFLTVSHSNCTLLSVPRCELVSNLRHTDVTDSNLRETVSLFRCADENIVYNSIFVCFHRSTTVTFCVARWFICHGIGWSRLSNEDIISRHTSSGLNQAIFIQFAVISVFHSTSVFHGRAFEKFRIETSYTGSSSLFLVTVAAIV